MRDNKSIHGFNLSFLFLRTDIFSEAVEVMEKWIEQNKIKIAKVNLFKIWDVARAHQFIQTGNSIGKIVLDLTDN